MRKESNRSSSRGYRGVHSKPAIYMRYHPEIWQVLCSSPFLSLTSFIRGPWHTHASSPQAWKSTLPGLSISLHTASSFHPLLHLQTATSSHLHMPKPKNSNEYEDVHAIFDKLPTILQAKWNVSPSTTSSSRLQHVLIFGIWR